MSLNKYFETDDLVLSEERLVEVNIEANDYLVEAISLADDIKRMQDLHVGLEQLEEAIVSIEAATVTDIRLVHVATSLALAGTDISVESIVPSLENFEGTTISTESIKSVIKSIWDAIVNTLTKIWNAITGFISRLMDNISKLKERNDNMRERLQAKSTSNVKEKKLELDKEAEYLSIGGKVIGDTNELLTALNTLVTQSNIVFNEYTTILSKVGNDIAIELDRFDVEKPSESLIKVNQVAKGLDLAKLKSLFKTTEVSNGDNRWGGGKVSTADPLLGNKSIFFYKPHIVIKEMNDIVEAEIIRNTKVVIDNTNVTKNSKVTKPTMITIEASKAPEIHRLLDNLLTMVQDYNKRSKDILSAKKRLDAASKSMTSRFEKNSDIGNSIRPYYQSAAGYNIAYAIWALNPQAELAKHILSVVRSVITVCNRAVNNYE